MWQLARFILATNRYADSLKLSADRLRITYATSAASATQREVLDPWLSGFRYTTPVQFDPRDNPPTAQSWLRRFGANAIALDKVFRTKQVRIFDGTKFKRIKNRTKQLQQGDVLLVPVDLSRDLQLLARAPAGAAAAMAAVRKLQAEQKDRLHGDDDAEWAGQQADMAQAGRKSAGPAAAGAAAAGQQVQGAAAAAADDDDDDDDDELDEWLAEPGPASARAARSARPAASPAPAHATVAAAVPDWAGGRAVPVPADNRDAALRQQREQAHQQAEQQRAAEPLERAVRRWIIAREGDYLVLNKPPGVHVTGGPDAAGHSGSGSSSTAGGNGNGSSTAGAGSIEQVLDSSLKLGEADQPTLVHHLAPAASGCLLVARSPAAADWLQEAFQRGHAYVDPTTGQLVADPRAEVLEDGATAGRRRRPKVAVKERRVRRSLLPIRVSVGRTYLAVVQGNMQAHRKGVVNKQVMEGGQLRAAKTAFKVRHTGDGLTLLELTPLTAAREQLQVHCARELGHPLLGDYRRGFDPAAMLQAGREQHAGGAEGAWPAARLVQQLYGSSRSSGGRAQQPAPLLLHLYSVSVRKGRKQTVVSRARLPDHMRELCKAMHWIK